MTRSRRTSRGLRRNSRQHHALRLQLHPLHGLRQLRSPQHARLHLLHGHNRSSRLDLHLRHGRRRLHGLRLKSEGMNILNKGCGTI